VPRYTLTEVREHRLRHNDDAEQIRFNLCAEIRERGIFYGAYVAITGIVNKDVEATESFDRGVDSVLGLSFVRDIERNSPHTFPELASEINKMLRIAGRGHDAVPGLESLFCERPAEAAGSSGN